MVYSARYGLFVPLPITSRHNEYLALFEAHSAVLVKCCLQAALWKSERKVGRLDLAELSYQMRQDCPRHFYWYVETATCVKSFLSPAEVKLLDVEFFPGQGEF